MNGHRFSPRIGGLAALAAAATFLFGFVLLVTTLSDYAVGDPTPRESATFVAEHQTALFAWHLVIYLVFGAALVPLVLALYGRLKDAAPGLSQAAAAFGIIWAGLVFAAGMVAIVALGTVKDLNDTEPAQAAVAWSSIDAVQNGLGGGNEIVGGLWVLLVSVAALGAALPKALGYLGIGAGAAGVLTVVPALEEVGAVFGLGLIAWFVWAGVALLRSPSDTVSAPAVRIPVEVEGPRTRRIA